MISFICWFSYTLTVLIYLYLFYNEIKKGQGIEIGAVILASFVAITPIMNTYCLIMYILHELDNYDGILNKKIFQKREKQE